MVPDFDVLLSEARLGCWDVGRVCVCMCRCIVGGRVGVHLLGSCA